MVHRPWILPAALLFVLCLATAPAETGTTAGGGTATSTGALSPGNTRAETQALSAFSKASAEWGTGIEAVIEDAYRRCFRTFLVDGRFVTLRMPFGENNERSELADADLAILGGGKADPAVLWDTIGGLLETSNFQSYTSLLADGQEKVIIFDIGARGWSTTRDRFTIDRIRTGAYPGLPHKPYVLTRGRGVTAADIYNYLYCVGRVGMDCSGFVWHVLGSVAAAGGLDLDRTFGRYAGAPRSADVAWFIGTWFFDPKNRNLEEVKDEIRNLRPADIIVFRGDDGTTRHSAVIQSIDRVRGTIRYLQSTDEAPQDERGVHESLITFDPARPQARLDDPSITWHQLRAAAFDGEGGIWFRDDGERYRAYPEHGGGTVVRLKALSKVVAKLASTSGR
jgi:cell wall-associated NlpC family hydrolase